MSDYQDDEELEETGDYSIEIPEFREWKISSQYDYTTLTADFEDLNDLNKQINAAKIALFKLTDAINKAERKAKAAKVIYERNYRRKYINSSEKTEAAKRVSAEILVEDLENRYMYYEQMFSELNRASYTLRQELRSLEVMANNYRQQIKMV